MSCETGSQAEMLERVFSKHVSNADFFTHVLVLGLGPEDFIDKTVLDIGSGQTNRFVREAQESVNPTNVISVNPILAFEGVCSLKGISRQAHKQSVAALAQGWLPFKDESFDTIGSVLGVPNYLTNEEISPFYNEVWRILKPGGRASFWPFAHQQTNDRPIRVEGSFLQLENVDSNVLAVLPEDYRHLVSRVIVGKSSDDTDLPDKIAY